MCRSDSHANPSCRYLDPYIHTFSYCPYRHAHTDGTSADSYSWVDAPGGHHTRSAYIYAHADANSNTFIYTYIYAHAHA